VYIGRPDLHTEEGIWHDVLMLFNPYEGNVPFQIPQFGEGGWVLELTTATSLTAKPGLVITREKDFELEGRSIALFRRP
jgi:glycogen operon protein